MEQKLEDLKRIGGGLLGRTYTNFEDVIVKHIYCRTNQPNLKAIEKGLEKIKGISYMNISSIIDFYIQPEIDEIKIKREYVKGKNLEEYIKEKDKFTITETSDIIFPLAKVLSDLGEKYNLIHGNLKPSNVIINLDDKKNVSLIKIVDFCPPALIQYVLNNRKIEEKDKPYYHPSVLQGKQPVHQTDIYSIGAIAYRMLKGKSYEEGNKLNLEERAKEFEDIISKTLRL